MLSKKSLLWLVILTVGLMLTASVALAQSKDPVATIKLKSTSIAIGIGVNWGSGSMEYQGQTYKFDVSGLSIADLGVSSVSAIGEVYDLKQAADLNGTYTAAKAGIALGAGAEGLTMSNENGVIVNLRATQVGVKLSLALEGLSLKITD